MIITRAALSDVDTIMSWRRERTAWLATRGEDQWSIPLPRSAVAATVSAGQTWMVWDDHVATGTITLAAATDATGSGSRRTTRQTRSGIQGRSGGRALRGEDDPLVHSGDGLGGELLDWAGGRAYAAGLTWLRLDAWTTNEKLHDYYRQLGFRHVRTVESRISGACFQRAAQPYDGRLKTDGG